MIKYVKGKMKSFFAFTLVYPVDKEIASSSSNEHQSSFVRRLEKKIGLIPQDYCLFKFLEYEVSLVSRSNLDQCVKNELSSLVTWSNVGSYHLVYKVDSRWRVALWFWDADGIFFPSHVTHIIPSLAYYTSGLKTTPALLCHQDMDSIYVCRVTSHGELAEFYRLDNSLSRYWLDSYIEQGYPIYATQDNIYVDRLHVTDIHSLPPPRGVLTAGKVSDFFDISSPWDFRKQMFFAFAASIIFIMSDLILLQAKSTVLENELAELSSNTRDLMKIRTTIVERSNIVKKLTAVNEQQKTVVMFWEMLINKLPEDVLLTDFTYEDSRAVIQGSVRNSVKLLDVLAVQPMVAEVRLLGDVTPKDDGSQVFKAEITLANK